MNNPESVFTKPFFEYLNQNEVRYAVARNASTLPESIPGSDIDLLIVASDFRRHRRAFSDLAKACGYRQWKCYRKNHSIIQISYAPETGSNPKAVVRLDFLLSGVFWKGVSVLSSKQWISGRVLLNNVWQIEGALMLSTTLANTWVYGGVVKERYVRELDQLPESGKKDTENHLASLFGQLGREQFQAVLKGDVAYDGRAIRRAFLFSSPWKIVRMPIGFVGMAQTLFSRVFNPPGTFIVLHGPDGCGKSAIAEEIKERTSQLFPDCLHFHLYPKPGFLSPLDRKSQQRWEGRQQTAEEWELRQQTRGTFRSLIQIVYLTFRYWMGYLFCIFPALMKGQLVLGERWNLDFLSDPASKGIFLQLKIRRFFFGLCPCPKRLILLIGDAEAMAARKIELPAEEIARQIELNRSLFSENPRTAFVDSTVEFEQTLSKTMEALLD